MLNSVYQKELWHQTRSLKGLAFADVGDNWTKPFKNWQRAEDALGHAFQQKNLGAFPSVQKNSPNSFFLGFKSHMSQASIYARQHFFWSPYKLFYNPGIKEFIYTIPRRFRNILSYYP